MSTGVLIVRLTHNYHSDLIRELINNGLPVRLVAISERVKEYQPDIKFLHEYKNTYLNWKKYLKS